MIRKQSLIYTLMAQMLFAQVAFSQATIINEDLNSEVDAEIESMYQQPGQSQVVISNPNSQSTSNAQSKAQGGVITQTVVIPQQQQQPAVQAQPETWVESSPLTNSRAEAIRRGRQDEELRTETKIVEKLEQSRLEDEKKRAEILFGDKFNALQNQQAQPQPQAYPIAQPVSVAPAHQIPQAEVKPETQPIIINQNETLTRDAVREEVRAALTEEATAVEPSLEQRYFTLNAGVGAYPDISTIEGNYSLGAGFGNRYDLFLVEGTFTYSSYNLDAVYTDQFNINRFGNLEMDQYQGSVLTKYQLLGGFIRPTVGGIVSYSYRQYTVSTNYFNFQSGERLGNSHSLDLGLTAGVDLEFNARMAFGVDMKYNFNLANRYSGPAARGYTRLESLEYFTTGIFARVNF